MANSLPLITIGIISYNRREKLSIVLDNLLRSDYPNMEIMVVDNASSDNTCACIRDNYPQVKLISLPENIGIGARNEFLFKAQGKYIIQYDDDSMPEDTSTISNIIKFMEAQPAIDAVCTKVLNVKGGFVETRDWEYFALQGTRELGYKGYFVHGSGMIFRADSIRRTKGYPAEFFWGNEESDLGLQMVKANLNAVYKPDFITLHLQDFQSMSRLSNTKRMIKVTRNTVWLMWKYFPPKLAIYLTFEFAGRRLYRRIFRPRVFLAHVAGILFGLQKGFVFRGTELLDTDSLDIGRRWVEGWFREL